VVAPARQRPGAIAPSRGSSAPAAEVPGVDPLRRFSRAVGHQIEAARETRTGGPHHVLKDRYGRRLRASAYGYRRGSNRQGGDLGPSSLAGMMPAGLKIGLVAVLAFGGFLGSSQVFIDYAAQLPDAHVLTSSPVPEDTLIYAADGSLLADLRQPGTGRQHYYQSLDQMGTLLPDATVAVEDANFWNEPGVDPQGIARAALADWRKKGTVQGASTITQQLVKLRLLKDSSQTLNRKVKEAILALQVERTYSKRTILEMYLNSVDYGNFAQGTQAAAQNYFRKNTKDLDLAEATMLAGIPQNPNINNPFVNWDIARNRQSQVLDAMVRNRYVTRQEADQAFAEDLRPQLHTPDDSIKAAPAFVSWIVDQLVAMYGQNATYEGGLRVYTSLQPSLQAIAEHAVQGNVLNNRSRNMQQGAMVSIDPRTGEVLTMVGSAFRDQFSGQFNYAADVPLSPGSSFKIFTYAAAIESLKYTMVTPVPDAPITVNMPGQTPHYQPKNYNAGSYPQCVLQTCMGNSLNVPAVYTEVSIGVDKVIEMARRLGAPPWLLINGTNTQNAATTQFGASSTLGDAHETPLQMATAVATIADMGVYHPPTGIVHIQTSDGTDIQLYDPTTVAKQVLDPRVAYIMQTIMSNDSNRSQIFGSNTALTLPGRRVAAKTGTAEDWHDGWTVGYTPSLASAFWFGTVNNTPMAFNFDAIVAAAPAWHAFMDQALNAMKASPSEWFSTPGGLIPAGNQVWLMPGTSASQPTPPLPYWASIAAPPAPKNNNPNPPNSGNNGNQIGG
jgi:membrane peptidoglycan carboxypeptidase